MRHRISHFLEERDPSSTDSRGFLFLSVLSRGLKLIFYVQCKKTKISLVLYLHYYGEVIRGTLFLIEN